MPMPVAQELVDNTQLNTILIQACAPVFVSNSHDLAAKAPCNRIWLA